MANSHRVIIAESGENQPTGYLCPACRGELFPVGLIVIRNHRDGRPDYLRCPSCQRKLNRVGASCRFAAEHGRPALISEATPEAEYAK